MDHRRRDFADIWWTDLCSKVLLAQNGCGPFAGAASVVTDLNNSKMVVMGSERSSGGAGGGGAGPGQKKTKTVLMPGGSEGKLVLLRVQAAMTTLALASRRRLPLFADDPYIWHPLVDDTQTIATALAAWSRMAMLGAPVCVSMTLENAMALDGVRCEGAPPVDLVSFDA